MRCLKDGNRNRYLKCRIGSESRDSIRCGDRPRPWWLPCAVTITFLHSSSPLGDRSRDRLNGTRRCGRRSLSYDVERCSGEDWVWCRFNAVVVNVLRSSEGKACKSRENEGVTHVFSGANETNVCLNMYVRERYRSIDA